MQKKLWTEIIKEVIYDSIETSPYTENVIWL